MMTRFSFAAGIVVAIAVFAACSSDSPPRDAGTPPPRPSPTATTSSAQSPTPAATVTAMPFAESGKQVDARWRWDSGLFNVILWPRANEDVVAVTWGGLYEGPGNFDSNPGGAALLDAATGSEIWKVETATQAFPAAFVSDVVVVGTGDGTVLALDRATGAERWRLAFDGIPFQALNAAGVLVIADADPETWGPNGLVDKTRLRGRVWGIDPATGTPIWKKTVGTFNAFIATDRQLVVAASSSGQNNEAAVFEAQTGKELWRTAAEASSPPAIRGGLVLLPGAELTALEADTGRRLWSRAPVHGGTFSFPAITGDVAVATSNTGTAEVTAVGGQSAGSLVAYAEIGESGGEWFELNGEIYGNLRGGLVRLEESPSGWRLVTIIIPQGSFGAWAVSPGGIALSTGIGSAPENVIFLEP